MEKHVSVRSEVQNTTWCLCTLSHKNGPSSGTLLLIEGPELLKHMDLDTIQIKHRAQHMKHFT